MQVYVVSVFFCTIMSSHPLALQADEGMCCLLCLILFMSRKKSHQDKIKGKWERHIPLWHCPNSPPVPGTVFWVVQNPSLAQQNSRCCIGRLMLIHLSVFASWQASEWWIAPAIQAAFSFSATCPLPPPEPIALEDCIVLLLNLDHLPLRSLKPLRVENRDETLEINWRSVTTSSISFRSVLMIFRCKWLFRGIGQIYVGEVCQWVLIIYDVGWIFHVQRQ